MQNKAKAATPEERERAVRLYRDQRSEYPSHWKAMQSIARKSIDLLKHSVTGYVVQKSTKARVQARPMKWRQ